jgi:hypothetical protein
MTQRSQIIQKSILSFLNRLDGGQAVEAVVHAAVLSEMSRSGEVAPSIAEMDAAFRRLDDCRWILGVHSRVFGLMKWSITDAGVAALLEM